MTFFTKVAETDASPNGTGPRAEAPQPIELHELLRRTYPDEHGLVEAGILIRRALAVFGGAPKLGKSSLVCNLVLLRGGGRPWLGFATSAGRTLVVQAEIPEPELQKRLGVMLVDTEAPPRDTVFFVTDRRIKIDQPAGLALLRQHIEQVRPDLLVIDPLARFMVGDENSTRDMGAIVAALDLLIQEYDLTIIVVHHTGKPAAEGGREGGHRLRGSSALFAAADSVLLLDRAKDGEGFKLSFELRHGKEPAPIYLTRSPHLWFVPAGPPAELLAVAFLVASGPLRWGHLVKAIQTDQGASKRTAERLLDRAKKAGLITQDAEGYYTATATYRQARSDGEVSV